MKNPAFSLILFCLFFLSFGVQSQTITTPRTASPAADVKQTIGISQVKVEYSRPSVKGRVIWGELVPYGYTKIPFGGPYDSPWRAGANENSVLILSHDATIDGKIVPAGSYGLFYAINSNNTGEVVLSKDYKSWGNYFYDPTNDQLRAPVTISDHSMTETLTYTFDNLSENSADLNLLWEKKKITVPISFDVNAIVIKNAHDQLKGGMGFNWESYKSAAVYAMGNESNWAQGLIWATNAVNMKRNFETLFTQSTLYRLNGMEAEAQAAQNEANQLANEVELNAYGYQLLNINQTSNAIQVFKSNTERYPQSANAWDSLGEAYAISGDKKNAIQAFKKSLSLNPPDNVRANSEKYLKQLEAK